MSNNAADYIESWAKQLGVANSPWAVAEYLVNTAKNYDTACAIIFGLGWTTHKEWLLRARDTMAQLPVQYPGATFPADWLYQWAQHYVTEIEALPT
jgi:hypothetical protein